MNGSKSLQCCYCKTILITLSKYEIDKLDGLNFVCDCCGHQNLLLDSKFHESTNIDPFLNITSFESFSMA